MRKLNKTELTAVICIGAVLLLDIVLLSVRLAQYLKAKRNMEENQFINPVEGRITSKYGNRIHPITGVKMSYHNGVDIAVSEGTPVLCPANGKVLKSYSNATGGNQVIIQHDNGWKTGYAHLQRGVFPVGTKVEQGTVIAYSGNTGKSTGAHLHFTLTDPQGTKQNPEDYFTF